MEIKQIQARYLTKEEILMVKTAIISGFLFLNSFVYAFALEKVNFGDYSSATLVGKAWAALAAKDVEAVETYTQKIIELYGDKAKEMQSSLTGYTWPLDLDKKNTFSHWALNDAGTALFILGEAYRNFGKKQKAVENYQKLINEYSYAQCWDPGGWFWNPADVARQKLWELKNHINSKFVN